MLREVYSGTHFHKGEYNIHNAIAGMRPSGRPVTVISARSVRLCVRQPLCLRQEKLDSSCSDISRMLVAPYKLTMEDDLASIKNMNYKYPLFLH